MPPRARQILDIAAVAFDEHGFHGTGMDELGRRAGLSGPALYRHFSGKDEILAGLLDEALDELMDAAAQRGGDPIADLRRALRHHVEYTLLHRSLVSVYQREGSSLAEPYRGRFRRRRRRYLEQWSSLVSEALPHSSSEDVATTAQALLGIVFSPTSWPARVAHQSSAATLLLSLVDSGLDGLLAGASRVADEAIKDGPSPRRLPRNARAVPAPGRR